MSSNPKVSNWRPILPIFCLCIALVAVGCSHQADGMTEGVDGTDDDHSSGRDQPNGDETDGGVLDHEGDPPLTAADAGTSSSKHADDVNGGEEGADGGAGLAPADSPAEVAAEDPDSAATGDEVGDVHESSTEWNDDALFAVTTQIFSEDATASYVLLTPTLYSDTSLSLDDAIEVPGRAIGVGPAAAEVLFVAGDADATVTRYDLVAGELDKSDTISFAGLGLAALGEYGGQFHFVADDKAYFFDGPTAQIVIFDPEAMTVRGSTALHELYVEDNVLTFSAGPIVVDDVLLQFAGWREGPTVPARAGVVAVDTLTDAARVSLDDRCGYVRDGVLAADGYVYLATEAYGAAVHRLNDANAPAPCLLRYDPHVGDFDAGFLVQLNQLAAGAATGSIVSGPAGGAFVKVLDESAFQIAEDTHPRVLASAPSWRWAALSLGEEPTLEPLTAPPDNGSVIVLPLGGLSVMAMSVGRDSTNFIELTKDGPGALLSSVPGVVFSAVKLR